jgi:hypothetical protein
LFADKAREQERTAARAQRKTTPDKITRISLASLDAPRTKSPGGKSAGAEKPSAGPGTSEAEGPDPVRNEALNILSDLAGQRVEEVARRTPAVEKR